MIAIIVARILVLSENAQGTDASLRIDFMKFAKIWKSKRKMMKRAKSPSHFIGHCVDCDFETQDYIAGKKEVIEHVKKTRHFVKGEIAYGFICK